MRTTFVGIIFLILSVNNLSAQKKDVIEYRQNWDKQQVFWGYYLGLNDKSFKIDYTSDADTFIDVKSSYGFNVGLIGDLRLHKNINLRLEPGLSSNAKELIFTYIEGGAKDSIRKVNSTYLRVPLLLKFSTDRYNNIRPYVLGGLSYDYNFSSNEDNPDDNSSGEFRMKTSNFSYELGVGIDIYFPFFIVSPSIRGVFQINNELVPDNLPGSPWTSPIDFFGTRGVFINVAFH